MGKKLANTCNANFWKNSHKIGYGRISKFCFQRF